MTYTFIVEAGNDPDDGPRYHPFYITDSTSGGILLDTPEDRAVCQLNECMFYISHWWSNYRGKMSKCMPAITQLLMRLLLVRKLYTISTCTDHFTVQLSGGGSKKKLGGSYLSQSYLIATYKYS